MEAFIEEMNAILVEAYYNILWTEEAALRKLTSNQISINEMHLLECVGKGGKEGVTNRAIAQTMRITPPSVTSAVNKLEKKGLLRKLHNSADGRQVRVVLTSAGRTLDDCHRRYHNKMVERLAENFTEEEQQMLLQGIRRLNRFFQESIEELV